MKNTVFIICLGVGAHAQAKETDTSIVCKSVCQQWSPTGNNGSQCLKFVPMAQYTHCQVSDSDNSHRTCQDLSRPELTDDICGLGAYSQTGTLTNMPGDFMCDRNRPDRKNLAYKWQYYPNGRHQLLRDTAHDYNCEPPPPPGPEYGTKNGVPVPYLPKFSNAYYPYAQRPNGCSMPLFQPGMWDSWGLSMAGFGYTISFKGACNEHDRCFYTLHKTYSECESDFEASLRAACESGLHSVTGFIVGMGGMLETCYIKYAVVYGATLTQIAKEAYDTAQANQEEYLNAVNSIIP